MAAITLGEAARLTKLGKTTLARAIKAGRLSATRTPVGNYEIDPSELARVYPFKPPTEVPGETVAATSLLARHTTPDATAVLEAQIAGLREVSDLLRRQLDDTRGDLRRQLDDVREDRDRWRAQAEAAQRLIAGHDHRSWWQRMTGK